jgi:hypothetical protein
MVLLLGRRYAAWKPSSPSFDPVGCQYRSWRTRAAGQSSDLFTEDSGHNLSGWDAAFQYHTDNFSGKLVDTLSLLSRTLDPIEGVLLIDEVKEGIDKVTSNAQSWEEIVDRATGWIR